MKHPPIDRGSHLDCRVVHGRSHEHCRQGPQGGRTELDSYAPSNESAQKLASGKARPTIVDALGDGPEGHIAEEAPLSERASAHARGQHRLLRCASSSPPARPWRGRGPAPLHGPECSREALRQGRPRAGWPQWPRSACTQRAMSTRRRRFASPPTTSCATTRELAESTSCAAALLSPGCCRVPWHEKGAPAGGAHLIGGRVHRTCRLPKRGWLRTLQVQALTARRRHTAALG